MSKTADLNTRIAEATETLTNTRQRHRTALEALALLPGDSNTHETARKTGVAVANAEGDLKLLNDAYGAAVAADQATDARARQLGAVAHLRQAVQLNARRNAAGAALDKTMQAFDKACKEWVQINGDLSQEIVEFYRTARPGNSNLDLRISLGDFHRAPCNALLSQFDAAVQGFMPRSAMALNYQTERGDSEEVAPFVRKTGERIIDTMQATAEAEGLPL